jgi:hypothetical protein
VERDVLDDPVALVEDSENRHPLRHWGDAGLAAGRSSPGSCRLVLLFAAAAAGGQSEREHQRCNKPAHAYSGIHGW